VQAAEREAAAREAAAAAADQARPCIVVMPDDQVGRSVAVGAVGFDAATVLCP
jgi:RNA-splicing ligase RtcB